MPNPLSAIRGSLKNIKDDYAAHAGITLSGGTYDTCWKSLCELVSVDNAHKSAKLLVDLREARFYMKKKRSSDVLITSLLSNKYRSLHKLAITHICGSTTPCTSAQVMAASIALLPFFSTRAPAFDTTTLTSANADGDGFGCVIQVQSAKHHA